MTLRSLCLNAVSYPILFLGLALVSGTNAARSDAPEPKGPLQLPSAGIPEDPLEPFSPVAPITDEETKKIEAQKLFVIGSGQLDNRQIAPAMRSFEKAIALDPKHLGALKELVPIALQAGDIKAGIDYCERALALDPNDAQLLHLLATRQAETAKLPEAVETLKRGLKLEGLLQSDPRLYLLIRSDLVQHLTTLNRLEESIEPLRDIIHLSENPDASKIGEFARRQLERRRLMDYEQLARTLGKLGRYDEAVSTIQKARAVDENGKRLALIEAELYFEQEKYDKAISELEAYIPLGLQNRHSFELYEKSLDKVDRRKDLLGQLGRWLDQDNNNPVLREFYAEKLIDAGEYEQAQSQLTRLRGRASSIDLLAKLYRKMNDPAKLLEVLTDAVRSPEQASRADEQVDAIAKEPELIARMAEIAGQMKEGEERVSANYLVSIIAAKAGNHDLSVELLRRCLADKSLPSNPQIHFQLIEHLSESKRYEEVIKAAEEAVKAHPAQRLAFLEDHAFALESLGKSEESIALIEDYLKEAKSNENVIDARLLLVRVYLQQEAFDKAVTVCRSILDDFPDQGRSIFAKYMLATVLSQKGELEEYEKISLELLNQADQLSPEFAATLNNDLGYTWADHGKNLDQAEALVRKALDAKPNEPAYMDSLGWVLFKKGDYAEAIEYLKKASESPKGQDSVIYDHLGDTYLKLEDRDSAKRCWTKAIELLAQTKTKKAQEQRDAIEKKMKLLTEEAVTPSP